MKPNYKKYVRMYYAIYIAAFFLYLAVSLFLDNMLDNFAAVILTAGGVYLITLILLRRFFLRKLITLFYKDLNGREFLEIVNIPRLGFAETDRMVVAQWAQDYQTVVNIATRLLNNKKTPDYIRDHCYSALTSTYFVLRDFENLKLVLEKSDELSKIYHSEDPDPFGDYYRNLLDRNYDACLEICEKSMAQVQPDSATPDYKKAFITYRAAVALYEKGDIQSARNEFESIIPNFPEYLPIVVLSKKYINAIDSGESVVISEKKILPEPAVIAKDKRRRVTRIITWTIIFFICLGIAIYLSVNTKDTWTVEYENRLNIAILETYEEAECINYFWLEKDGEELDSLCLVETNGKLALLSVTTPDGGKTSDTWVLKEGIDPSVDTSQYAMCVTSKYYIRMNFSTEKPRVEPLYYSVKFKFNGTTYWFYIDYYENELVFD